MARRCKSTPKCPKTRTHTYLSAQLLVPPRSADLAEHGAGSSQPVHTPEPIHHAGCLERFRWLPADRSSNVRVAWCVAGLLTRLLATWGLHHRSLADQAQLHDEVTLEACASACDGLHLPVAGIDGGNHCFCGSAADLATPAAGSHTRA